MKIDNFMVVLDELAENIKKKDEEIVILKYRVDDLMKKVIAAEKTLQASGKPQNIERR